ncbi:hypothetical protein [Pseudochryseolinea flava]|uniref:Uncharacterized protein n=1 Tax=Pseudochryseolinea flava TaxID=2059302 RepID=A0A364XWB7_9BACT|nr:hypothetical protein [Pseudochryseolinea flava]RAV98441.1 hypothetical protein DQQ10_24255 [Pseudochryseolinea flava]
MKFITFFALIFSLSLYVKGQDALDSLLNAQGLHGLAVSVNRKVSVEPFSQVQSVGYVYFSTSSDTVGFYIIEHNLSDSQQFQDVMRKRLISSSCQFKPHRNWKKNFMSFTKGNFYFVAPLCACTTVRDSGCARLARKINQWALLTVSPGLNPAKR